MSYRKFRADYLFTGYHLLDNQYVLITSEQGEVQQIVPWQSAGEDIEQWSGILCPGFINCHCHLELSHMKGLIPPGSGMINFLLAVIRQRYVSPEQVLQSIAAAENDMLHNGIVAVGDICNTADTIEQKKQGRLYYHNFIETTGFIDATAAQRFDDARKLFEQFGEQYSIPVESNSIVPHAPYSVSHTLFKRIQLFPGNHLLTMHNQESEAENEFFKTGTGDFLKLYEELKLDISFFQPGGSSSLQSCLPFFHANQSVILVHNGYLGAEDLGMARRSPAGIHFCICANANQYIGNALPDVDMLRRNNCSIVIGTDSLASNNQLSILAELKTLQLQFPRLSITELLQWATINGARALELDSLLGSFEPGKQPGVILVAEQLDQVKRLL